MKQIVKYIFAAILIIAVREAKSQNFYESYSPQRNRDTITTHSLSLYVYNNNFVNNNEYFGPYTEGITYIGSILQPEICLALSDKFSLSAGWYLRQYYGRDGFQKSVPLFRARYVFKPGAQLIVGQLDGQLQHGYIEPIYNTDNYFIKNPESGVQFRVDRTRIHTDLFLDWENFLLPGDAHQEEIVGGLLASFYMNDQTENQGLSAHFQSIIHHFGGQVDNVGIPIQSRANLATGLKYTFVPKLKLLNRLTLSSFYIQALDLSQTKTIPYKSGFAMQNLITAENKWLKLSTGWFHGEYFFAPMGDYLFQSVSQLNDWYMGDKRDLITSKLLLTHEIMKGVNLGIRFESYYDLQRKTNDFSYGLNVSVNTKVFEKKLR